MQKPRKAARAHVNTRHVVKGKRVGSGALTSFAFATVVWMRSCLIKSVTMFRRSAHLWNGRVALGASKHAPVHESRTM